ncbi:leucine-rich repeat domain-containing protein [Candidatus Gottesmanbacteria bacterium]|nr:leucine-rich repeat domain-containing protein [Candidatus Gottesmanbacteria bacterium]
MEHSAVKTPPVSTQLQQTAVAAPTTPIPNTPPVKNSYRIFYRLMQWALLALFITPATYRISRIIIETVADTVHNREYIVYDGASLSPIALFTRLSEEANVEQILIDSGDFVTDLPESIGNLTTVNGLYIFHNPIRTIPGSIGNLSALEHINIQNTHLVTLPDTLARNTNLLDISLQGNRITRLPDIFGSLQKLQVLNLAHNNLTSLPPSISSLTNLATLDLTGNKLTSVPENLPPNLEHLYLGGNPIPIHKLEETQLRNREDNIIIFY